MKIRLASDLKKESYADGLGIRLVVWNQGCKIACRGCHNKETWSVSGGVEYDIEDIKQKIKKEAYRHGGITLTGGDPFLQPEANQILAEFAHTLGLDVWVYSGETFDQLLENPSKKALLSACDILVDGPFILEERDITLAYRGSRNQRIIDIQKSLNENKIIKKEID